MCVEWNGGEVKKIKGGISDSSFPPVFWFSLYPSVPYDTAGARFNHPSSIFITPAPTFFHDHLGDGKGGARNMPHRYTGTRRGKPEEFTVDAGVGHLPVQLARGSPAWCGGCTSKISRLDSPPVPTVSIVRPAYVLMISPPWSASGTPRTGTRG